MRTELEPPNAAVGRKRLRAPRIARAVWRSARIGGLALLLLSITAAVGRADADVRLPQPNLSDRISIAADHCDRWQQGSYDVWVLRGHCYLKQGLTYARSQEAVLWIEHGQRQGTEPTKIIAYMRGEVTIDYQQPGDAGPQQKKLAARIEDETWFGRFYTTAPLVMRLPSAAGPPEVKPAIYQEGLARFDPDWGNTVRQAQFAATDGGPAFVDALPPGVLRVQTFPRTDVGVSAEVFPSADGQETVAVISSGVQIRIDGLTVRGRRFDPLLGNVSTVDVVADRMVIWTAGDLAGMGAAEGGEVFQREDVPLEIYMEGNIEFRQGRRVIFASRMYYNVRQQIGIVLDAEMLTPLPRAGFEGLVRLKAGLVQQLDESRFIAQDALITSSRMANPGYAFGAETIEFEDIPQPVVDPLTGRPLVDEQGQPIVDRQQLASSYNNFLYLSGVPVFYWPFMATNLEDPVYYIESLTVRNDDVFGTQVLLDLDLYQVFGLRDAPPGTKWEGSFDYLDKRGVGGGTNFRYDVPDLFGIPGRTTGFVDAWGIHDEGLDNLGRDRRALVPPRKLRGRVLARHRQLLADGYTFTGQLGLVGDRNFLEQYFEAEWDEGKDQITGIELKRLLDNSSWSINADVRVNEFFMQTDWLPRADHFWLGQSLFWDRVTWFEHTNVSFARLNAASPPTDPADKFNILPGEADVEGARVATRHELDLPLELGPFKVVPYALGEVAYWGEDLTGSDLTRLYFQTGARASIPFWSVDPTIESQLLNVHGIAHKVVLDSEFSYTDADQDLTLLPAYESVRDDSGEQFERRFIDNTFGGVLPAMANERFYAVRAGQAGNVTSPATEIVDDLMAVRMGMRNRWQTKRGFPGAQRIIDWIVLDANATMFPREEENFGKSIGLIDYDFRWHVGDRVTLLSDGYFDVFDDGLRRMTFGGSLNRPPRGSLFLGYRSFDGPFDAEVLLMSYRYRMSPKWASTFAMSIDLGNTENIGQRFTITRIGESLLLRAGFNVDASKGSVGATVLVEPRFLPRTRRGTLAGLPILPAGALGLE